MTRRILSIALLATALPSASLAQDFCAVLTDTLGDMTEARISATKASDVVSNFRFRLAQDQRRYGTDVEDLARPSDAAATSSNRLTTAVRDMTELKAIRCPALPDDR